MKFSKILLLIAVAIALSLILPGCATILGSGGNTLVFESENSNPARVYLDGEYIGDAPGKIKLKSRQIQHGSEIVVKPEGQNEFKQILLRKPHPVYMLMDIVLGGVPLGVDFATGQVYRPSPRKMNYIPTSN
ncbi:MAG: hypothetical protein K8R53_14060 [Bacteroidales bacterium]|nr:hypothetical protein [Bacteroidales bacterium]